MTSETKKLVLYALRELQTDASDNANRAKFTFIGRSPEEMQRNYGQSGESCQSILDGYLKREAEVNAAIAEIEASK